MGTARHRVDMAPLGERGTVASFAATCLVLLGACAVPTTAAYKLYPGPVRARGELAVLEHGVACTLIVDGLRAERRDWISVEVAPGPHRVQWALDPDAAAELEPAGGASEVVELEAGHVYRVRRKLAGDEVAHEFSWLADVCSGRVVAGRAPDLEE